LFLGTKKLRVTNFRRSGDAMDVSVQGMTIVAITLSVDLGMVFCWSR
jgi:hypothetical protein